MKIGYSTFDSNENDDNITTLVSSFFSLSGVRLCVRYSDQWVLGCVCELTIIAAMFGTPTRSVSAPTWLCAETEKSVESSGIYRIKGVNCTTFLLTVFCCWFLLNTNTIEALFRLFFFFLFSFTQSMWIGRVLSTWYPHAHIKNWWSGGGGLVREGDCVCFCFFFLFPWRRQRHDDELFAWLITIWLKCMLQFCFFFCFYLILLKLEQRQTRIVCFRLLLFSLIMLFSFFNL